MVTDSKESKTSNQQRLKVLATKVFVRAGILPWFLLIAVLTLPDVRRLFDDLQYDVDWKTVNVSRPSRTGSNVGINGGP